MRTNSFVFVDYDTMDVLESCILPSITEAYIKLNKYLDKGYYLVEEIDNYQFGLRITYKLRKKEENN